MPLTNKSNLPISIAVWLAHDEYDHNPDPKAISATSLLKSTKQIVLGSRVSKEAPPPTDIMSLVDSRVGTAVHNAIETAWKENLVTSMSSLGYPDKLVEKIVINPKPEELTEDSIPVYMELRAEKEIMGFTVSGKYDFIIEGGVEDFKTTGTYTFTHKTNDKKYALQGSIYRWLNPDIITKDHLTINYIFKNWNAGDAARQANYPDAKIKPVYIPLLSIPETEHFVKTKLTEVMECMDKPENEIPDCTSEDLWRDKSVFKYYKNPNNTSGRSTKNFDNIIDANIRMQEDANVGVVVEVPGKVKACKYCDAATVCKQKDVYIANGTLVL